MLLGGTATSALESDVILSAMVSVGEEVVGSGLLSTRLPVFVSKDKSCKASVVPESKKGVPGDL